MPHIRRREALCIISGFDSGLWGTDKRDGAGCHGIPYFPTDENNMKTKKLTSILQTIINTLHTSPSPSLNKTTIQKTLPRYLRCLFQLSIQANEFPLAEAILDKSLSLAREEDNAPPPSSPNGKKTHCYPNEELEWLATTAFNRAMDFYLASADEDCRRWAGKAIEIADEVKYNQGALGRLLRENLNKLPWVLFILYLFYLFD